MNYIIRNLVTDLSLSSSSFLLYSFCLIFFGVTVAAIIKWAKFRWSKRTCNKQQQEQQLIACASSPPNNLRLTFLPRNYSWKSSQGRYLCEWCENESHTKAVKVSAHGTTCPYRPVGYHVNHNRREWWPAM
eukprot:PhF_6_TR9761/c0_g1_i1/m.15042